MSYVRVIKSSLLALIPVVLTLAVWIMFRGDQLAALFQNLRLLFFMPVSTIQAILGGWLVWFSIALVFSFIGGYFYYWVTQKWHWPAIYYALALSGLGVLISLLIYFLQSPLAAESAGELLIVAIGFGVFIPWFAQQNLRQYY
jgi:hypothetical protein